MTAGSSWSVALALALAVLAPDAARAGGSEAFVQEARLAASFPVPFGLFGWSVDVSGDTAVVGSSGVAAYVFRRSGAAWTEEQVLTDALPGGSIYASAVAIDGDTVAVGAYGDDTFCPGDPNCNAGAVHVYTRSGSAWSLQQTLFSPSAAPGNLFGYSVALDGDTLLVGERDGDLVGAANAGAAYAFVRTGASWSLQQRLVAANGASGDFFGIAVAVDGDRALVGASQRPSAGFHSGSAYAFARTGASWTQEQELVASDAAQNHAFGEAVSLSGTLAAVGAPGNAAAYVFARGASSWSQEARLVAPDAAPDDAFATTLALSGDVLAVGASGDDDTGSLSGSVHVFERSGAGWSALQKLAALDASPGDQLGWAVALDGDALVASAVNDDAGGQDTGSACVFRLGPAPFESFCNGADGALAACPCGNPGLADTGCENALGTGGVRLQTIAIDVANGYAALLASGYPVTSRPAALVLRADVAAPPSAFFDGVLCLGATGFVRLQAGLASGGVSRHVLLHQGGPGTFRYQVWYRSSPASYCNPTAAANTSGGVSITW